MIKIALAILIPSLLIGAAILNFVGAAHGTTGVEMLAPKGGESAPGQLENTLNPPGQGEYTPGLAGQNEALVGQGYAKGNGQLK